MLQLTLREEIISVKEEEVMTRIAFDYILFVYKGPPRTQEPYSTQDKTRQDKTRHLSSQNLRECGEFILGKERIDTLKAVTC